MVGMLHEVRAPRVEHTRHDQTHLVDGGFPSTRAVPPHLEGIVQMLLFNEGNPVQHAYVA